MPDSESDDREGEKEEDRTQGLGGEAILLCRNGGKSDLKLLTRERGGLSGIKKEIKEDAWCRWKKVPSLL